MDFGPVGSYNINEISNNIYVTILLLCYHKRTVEYHNHWWQCIYIDHTIIYDKKLTTHNGFCSESVPLTSISYVSVWGHCIFTVVTLMNSSKSFLLRFVVTKKRLPTIRNKLPSTKLVIKYNNTIFTFPYFLFCFFLIIWHTFSSNICNVRLKRHIKISFIKHVNLINWKVQTFFCY